MANNPSLVDAAVNAMQQMYPEELADKAWDNTGLLLEDFREPWTKAAAENVASQSILLTNDLTSAVVDEALEVNAKIIISYHPVIFRPLKSITTNDPIQRSLLRLAANRIAVYCPHTAVDAAHGGLNDWLCDILLPAEDAKSIPRSVVQPISRPISAELHQGAGYGRVFQYPEATYLGTVLKRLAKGLGDMRYLSVALPEGAGPDRLVSKIAVCAGSGSDVLKDTDADVLVTGEMSHHYALRHIQLGQIVITAFHSNSERQYLEQRLKPLLQNALGSTPFAENPIVVSKKDRDPFKIIDVSQLG